MKYPSNEEIEEVLKDLSDEQFSSPLPKNPTVVDIAKYNFCKKFIIYLREEDISQSELAKRLGVDRSRINWIVKYRIQHFTIDKLYELWTKVDPDFRLKVC